SMISGYAIIPMLNIVTVVDGLKALPPMLFKLNIPPVLSVMSALVLALFLGLAIVWTNSKKLEAALDEFNNVILSIVHRIIIPILPFFIASTFATLAYEGSITKQLPVFLKVVVIVLIGHFIWLTILYSIGGAVSKQNPFNLLKSYGPAYLTAVGTMSSAATLPVALSCAKKSNTLDEDVANFAIPLGATVHLCGSVLTEVFFVMTVSQVLYGTLPTMGTMVLFIVLLGIFAIGAPGVPGGTVMASLGIISSVLGFDDTGIALMLTIFALQDSFGTACNVVGDGALALILNGLFKKNKN
ncbi:MAG: cation:dicarboxylate symporter family transporter, partial [Cetobacterium sp.]